MIRRRNPFPGVSTKPDRHGKLRHRLRRTVKGLKVDTYLPGPYGSPAFRAAFEEALEGARIAAPKAQPGTFNHLIVAYLESPAFRSLAPSTRESKLRRLNWIREAIGAGRYANLRPDQVESLMTKKNGPTSANRLRKDLAEMFNYAAWRLGFKWPNPAKLADSIKVRSTGYHTWTDAEITAYRDAHPSGTTPRLALEIILGTGAARSDAVALTRSNIKGGHIRYRRKKTGIAAELPVMSELARELDYIPPGQMVLLATESGTAYTPKGISRMFPQWCERAGLVGCSTHGLRKARARILAEAGATENEIMSYLAHATPKEGATYTAAANRSAMTTSAVAKLLNKEPTNLSNRSGKLDKWRA